MLTQEVCPKLHILTNRVRKRFMQHIQPCINCPQNQRLLHCRNDTILNLKMNTSLTPIFNSGIKNSHSFTTNDGIKKKTDFLCSPAHAMIFPHRSLWSWLNLVFNKVDDTRIKAVGADRACAEWLLRCGAIVKWKDSESFLRDYNSLPLTGGVKYKIQEIDATDSAVMHVGFLHFRGCKYIRRIIFHKAIYLTDDALAELHHLKDSLQELQISSCGNITITGLRQLSKLRNLAYLNLYDLPEIENKDEVIKELQSLLPHCAIVFPYAQAKDRPAPSEEENNT